MIPLHFCKANGVTSPGPVLHPEEFLRLIGSDSASYQGPHLPVLASHGALAACGDYLEVLAVVLEEDLAALPKEQFPLPGVYCLPRNPEDVEPAINRRWTGLTFHLDTNRLNARRGQTNMSRLEHWCENGVIRLYWSATAFREAIQGRDGKMDRNRLDKARNNMISEPFPETREEQDTLDKIGRIVFPPIGPQDDNQSNDALIVFTARKYGAVLITNDGASFSQPGGILGAAAQLKNVLGIEVMRDDEAVARVQKAIENRDMTIRQREKRGERIPEWVGKD